MIVILKIALSMMILTLLLNLLTMMTLSVTIVGSLKPKKKLRNSWKVYSMVVMNVVRAVKSFYALGIIVMNLLSMLYLTLN